jgi:hypothetical protein
MHLLYGEEGNERRKETKTVTLRAVERLKTGKERNLQTVCVSPQDSWPKLVMVELQSVLPPRDTSKREPLPRQTYNWRFCEIFEFPPNFHFHELEDSMSKRERKEEKMFLAACTEGAEAERLTGNKLKKGLLGVRQKLIATCTL